MWEREGIYPGSPWHALNRAECHNRMYVPHLSTNRQGEFLRRISRGLPRRGCIATWGTSNSSTGKAPSTAIPTNRSRWFRISAGRLPSSSTQAGHDPASPSSPPTASPITSPSSMQPTCGTIYGSEFQLSLSSDYPEDVNIPDCKLYSGGGNADCFSSLPPGSTVL